MTFKCVGIGLLGDCAGGGDWKRPDLNQRGRGTAPVLLLQQRLPGTSQGRGCRRLLPPFGEGQGVQAR